nr:PREDICTED: ubiquitin carboxyl-terminal hydrolase 37-like isoform X1 [Lepisosteus oculatus]
MSFAHLLAGRNQSSLSQKEEQLRCIKTVISAPHEEFSGDRQQDAHEFLSHCLSQLKEEGQGLNLAWARWLLSAQGAQPEGVKCLHFSPVLSCETQATRTEVFHHLSLDLLPLDSIQDCLELYFKLFSKETQTQRQGEKLGKLITGNVSSFAQDSTAGLCHLKLQDTAQSADPALEEV